VRVEHPPGLGAVLGVDVTGALGPSARAKALSIPGRGAAVAPVGCQGLAQLRVDQLGQRRAVGLVPNVPGLQPRQLGVGRAGTGLGHLRSTK